VTRAAFQRLYLPAFRAFVRERDERTLRTAYELGRDAVEAGVSALEIVSVHHDVLERAVAGASPEETRATISAASEFLVEALAAFEMVQRGFSDVQRAAFAERRNARMLRHLSTLLADVSLASGEPEALEEVLQLVAEHAREITNADRAAVRISAEGGASAIEVESESGDDDSTWSEVLQPPEVASEEGRPGRSLQAPLLSLDGALLGQIEVDVKHDPDVADVDEALLAQVAEMAAAAVERALAYR
jgi:hypothetical protein